MTFEEIRQQFIDNGFQVNGNTFVHERVEYSTININGQIHQQPHRVRFVMNYAGDGCVYDNEESDGYVIHQFDILGNNNEIAFSIGIENFDDFTKIVK